MSDWWSTDPVVTTPQQGAVPWENDPVAAPSPATPAPVAPTQQMPWDSDPIQAPAASASPANNTWAISRGFMTGMAKENPEGLADFLEAQSHLAPGILSGPLSSASGTVRGFAKSITPEDYKRTAPEFENIAGIGDAMNWLGEGVGAAVASSVPSIVLGGLGAGVGGATAGPVGVGVGALVGAGGASYALNQAEVYNALKQEKMDPALAAKWSAAAAVPISGLDMTSLGFIVSRFGGAAAAKRELVKGLARRIATATAESAGTEATTETLQEMLKDATVSLATGKDFVTAKNASQWLQSGIIGGATGGLMGGPAGIRRGAPGAADAGIPADNIVPETDPTASVESAPIVEPLPDIAQLSRVLAALDGKDVATPLPGVEPTPSVAVAEHPNEPGKMVVVEQHINQAPIEQQAQEGIETQKPVFYSQLAKVAAERLPESMTAEQALATLRNAPGVKQEEIDSTNLESFLAQSGGRVSKADLLAHLEENSVQVSEVVHGIGEPGGLNKFSLYTTPGPREGSRELLLTLPGKEPAIPSLKGITDPAERQRITSEHGTASRDANLFRGSHWSEPNVVAHVRFTDRHDSSGQPVLHIEEIQSDWHQKGRQEGYQKAGPRTYTAERIRSGPGQFDNVWKLTDQYGMSHEIAGVRTAEEAIRDAQYYGETRSGPRRAGVPDAPFKTTWPELAIKRMIRWAADNGYSRISWNNGDLVAAHAAGGATNTETIQGLDKFYNQIIPSIMKKYAKRLGGTIGATRISTAPAGLKNPIGDYSETVLHLDIPPSARTQIQSGFPMFARGVETNKLANVVNAPDFRAKASPEFQRAVTKMAQVLDGFAKKFGLDTKLTLVTQWSDGRGVDGMKGTLGLAQKFGPDTYVIKVDASLMKGNTANFLAVMMHEFGHVVVWDKFAHLSDADRNAIRAEYDSFFRDATKDGTVVNMYRKRLSSPFLFNEVFGSESALGNMKLSNVTQRSRDYHLGFDEWIADQVARWATTTPEPVNLVDRIMQGIGKALRVYQEYMAKALNLDLRPTLAVQNWLNSFITDAGPMTATEYAAQDLRTQKQNLNVVGHGIPMPGHIPAMQPIRNTVNQVYRGAGGGGPAVPIPVQQAAAHADRINKFYEYMAGVLELLDANPRFEPLKRYVEGLSAMHREESKIQDATVRIVKDWRSLGKQGENLTAFLDDLTNMVYRTPQEIANGVVRHPSTQEMQALVRKHKLDRRAGNVFNSIRNFFTTYLDLVAQNAIAEANKITDPVARTQAVTNIMAEVQNAKRRPYFPFMRFGSHYVTVRDPQTKKVIWFETFERTGPLYVKSAVKNQTARAEELRRSYGANGVVETGILDEHVEHLVGLPPTLLKHMQAKMTLTQAQVDALEQLQFQFSPALSFKHRFQHKAYTPGYSHDFMRSFSRYGFSGARYYARTKYVSGLQQNIEDARKLGGNDKTKPQRIAKYMADHLQNTILDARGDYGFAKGAIFTWALGYVPQAAFQNLTQTPMITYPWLASKFGDLRTGKAMINSMRKLNSFYRKGFYEGTTEFELQAINYGIKTGRISETQAAELAALSNGGNLVFGAGGTELHRTLVWAQENAALFFETAEQFNRRLAFRAALELAMNNPNAKVVREAVSRYQNEYNDLVNAQKFTPQQASAIITANHAVEQTQFVYGRYARPRFMRGRLAGTLFVFKRYVQSVMLMFLNGDKGYRTRYLLMAMLMGGMGGAPLYDELLGIITGVWKMLGYDSSPEVEVRRFINEVVGNKDTADLVLHGLARRGFGIPALLDLLGNTWTGRPGRGFDSSKSGQNIPFPVFDRSKSVSAGPLLPIDLGKILGGEDDTDKTISQQAQRASGAVFSVGFNMYRALTDSHLAKTDPKRWERAIPAELGNLSKSYRAFTEGRERSRGGPNSGATLVSYDIRDTEQMMEAIGVGMGYHTFREMNQWDRIRATQEHIHHIDMKRKGLLEQLFEAQQGQRPQEIEKVADAIRKFNIGLSDTDRGKSISGEQAAASIQNRAREKNAMEAGVPTKRGNIPIARDIQSVFPDTTVDVRRR